jgi:hypothetical protein
MMIASVWVINMLVLLSVSILSLSYPSSVTADKDYCYDEVGDGHYCFVKEKKCENVQKHDEIAESPCYNKDEYDY